MSQDGLFCLFQYHELSGQAIRTPTFRRFVRIDSQTDPIFEALGQIRANLGFSPIRIEIRVIYVAAIPLFGRSIRKKTKSKRESIRTNRPTKTMEVSTLFFSCGNTSTHASLLSLSSNHKTPEFQRDSLCMYHAKLYHLIGQKSLPVVLKVWLCPHGLDVCTCLQRAACVLKLPSHTKHTCINPNTQKILPRTCPVAMVYRLVFSSSRQTPHPGGTEGLARGGYHRSSCPLESVRVSVLGHMHA